MTFYFHFLSGECNEFSVFWVSLETTMLYWHLPVRRTPSLEYINDAHIKQKAYARRAGSVYYDPM
jgi:hypothetical protein